MSQVMSENVVEFERWTAPRKGEAVLGILKGQTTLIDFCRANDLKQSEVEKWIEEFIQAGRNGLKKSRRDARSPEEIENDELKKLVGEQTIIISVLKKSIEKQERMKSESNPFSTS